MISPKGNISRVVALLTPKEKRRLWVVILAAIFVTIIMAVGIGSIMPFVTVAAKPVMIHENYYLRLLFDFFGFTSDRAFLIFLGVTVLGMLIITNASQALLHYIKVRFTTMRQHTLSLRLLTGYLRQPFAFFLNRNSYDLIKNINIEIEQMINLNLLQLVEALSRSIQVFLLTLFLVLIHPTSTLVIATVIIAIYSLIYVTVKRVLKRLGSERFELNADRSRIVSEAFWGIKEMKIANREATMTAEFAPPSRKLAKAKTTSAIIASVPKFALEAAAFSAIVGYVLFSIVRSGSFQDVAGSVTLFAYAGYRMIPAIQAMFKALTQLRYGAATAEKIAREFEIVSSGLPLLRKPAERLPFKVALKLRNVRFTYPNMDVPVIPDISLDIPTNSLVGFAGRTGSGKTTLVDVIMGLLDVEGGSILIDGIALNADNLRRWQANLGYVPQTIYLADDSIAANIAFGVRRKDIDMESVTRAARLSQIHSFVEEELPEKYETRVGERGIRLSGGQRQRIGIARALYRDPSVLILDEATSALDSHTERAVMEAIDKLHGTRTIIMIAHRLSTLMKCDIIYHLEKGRVFDSGTYSELKERSKYFV